MRVLLLFIDPIVLKVSLRVLLKIYCPAVVCVGRDLKDPLVPTPLCTVVTSGSITQM